jgi:excinuclease UvrABC ATPase subunit
VFTGVSGSGKSSLIDEAFLHQYPDLDAFDDLRPPGNSMPVTSCASR